MQRASARSSLLAVLVSGALLLPAALLPAAAPRAAGGEQSSPDNQALRRELSGGADALRAALRDTLPGLRVVDVEAGYLAGQGALVIVDVASPWFRIDGPDIDVDPLVESLEEIPDLIHEILRDLDLGLSPHQVEELQELRGMREGQRALRAEERALRAQLREQRRQLLRAESAEARAALDGQIAALRAALEGVREQERALERQATDVRATLDAPVSERGRPPPPTSTSIDQAVAEVICGSGDAFESLSADEYLNVLVRERGATRYYVFRMDQIRGCERGGAAELLRQADYYES